MADGRSGSTSGFCEANVGERVLRPLAPRVRIGVKKMQFGSELLSGEKAQSSSNKICAESYKVKIGLIRLKVRFRSVS